jgi:uncharacterized protein (TIGR03435 family)
MARLGGEGSGRESVSVSPTTAGLRNASLSFCIQWAYGVRFYQVSGPDWISRSRYDIVAKTENASGGLEPLKAMMRSLLADRFQLRLHQNIRTIPVYELAASRKAKLTTAADNEKPGMSVVSGGFVFEHVTMPDFAERLSDFAAFDRPVLDKTGINGFFDITLTGAASAMRENPDSIFSAVEAAGFRLNARKDPIEILIVDRAVPPSAN